MSLNQLSKHIKTIGKNKEFYGENGAPLSLGYAPEFLTREFIYDLRKRAKSCNHPMEVLWHIIEQIERQGKLKRGQSKDEDHTLAMNVAYIFCHTFGVDIVQAKLLTALPPFDDSFKRYDGWYTTTVQACLDLYRDEWEALIKEYENEKKNND